MTTITETAQVFDLRTPYLTSGRTTEIRARTDNLTMTVKVYAEGGENAMHHHANEDHSFVVIEGEATFHVETDDDVRVVGRYEGIMLPRGVNYWFQASSDENLVMLRVGALLGPRHEARLTPDGRDIPGNSLENKSSPRIEKAGPGFGA